MVRQNNSPQVCLELLLGSALPGEEEQKAAKQFEQWVCEGIDLEPYVPTLLRIYRESSNVTIMEPIANCLAHHFIKTKQINRLSRLLRRPKFSTYLLDGISKTCRLGTSIECAIIPVVRCYGRDWSLVNSGVKDVLFAYIKDDPKRLSSLSTKLARKPLWRTLLLDFLGDFWHRRDVDYEPALPVVVALFSHRRRLVRHKAAEIVDWAASKSCSMECVSKQLEKALASGYQRIRETASFALAHGNPRRFVKMIEIKDDAIRIGAVKALSSVVGNENVSSLIERVVLLLTVRSDALRKVVAQRLSRIRVRKLSDETIFTLLSALKRKSCRYAIGQFFCDWLNGDKLAALSFLERMAKFDGKRNSSFFALEKQVKQVCDGTLTQDCAICSVLGRRLYESNPERFPPEIKSLQPALQFSDGPSNALSKCCECLNWYSFQHEVDHITLGDIHHYALKRLTPSRALKCLQGELKAELLQAHSGLIANFERDLAALAEKRRVEAAWSLTEHYVQANEWESMKRLLLHKDQAVQVEVLRTLEELAQERLVLLIPLLEKLCNEGSKPVNTLAAKVLCRQYVRCDSFNRIAALVTGKSDETNGAALHGLRMEKLSRAQVAKLLPILTQCLCSSLDKTMSVARMVMKGLFERQLVNKYFLATIHELLRHKSDGIRSQAAALLGDWLTYEKKLSPDIGAIAALLCQRSTQSAAFYALRVAINKGFSIEPAFGAIAKAIMTKECRGMSDALWAIQSAVHENKDISPIIEALGVLAGGKKYRQRAVSLLRKAADNGICINNAERGLKKAVKDDSAFIRQEARAALNSGRKRKNE